MNTVNQLQLLHSKLMDWFTELNSQGSDFSTDVNSAAGRISYSEGKGLLCLVQTGVAKPEVSETRLVQPGSWMLNDVQSC